LRTPFTSLFVIENRFEMVKQHFPAIL